MSEGAAWLNEVRRVAQFRAALRRFERTTERVARAAGVTPRQYLLLLTAVGMADGPRGVTVNELAGHLQIAQSTATGLVDRAEAAGLVRRSVADHDARFVHVDATEHGRRVLERTMRALEAERDALAEVAAELGRHLADSDGRTA